MRRGLSVSSLPMGTNSRLTDRGSNQELNGYRQSHFIAVSFIG